MIPTPDDRAREIGAQVLLLLRRNPDGLTSLRLSRLLEGHPPAYQITLVLKSLHERKAVRLINGIRWRCAGEFPAAREQVIPAITTVQDSAAGATRWEPFRRLCQYYADCARVEAGAHVEAFADQEKKLFAQIGTSIDWAAFSAGESVFLDAREPLKPYLARLAMPNAPPVYLGGPLQLWIRGKKEVGESYRFVSPLFLIPVRVRLSDHDMACIEPLGPPEINTKWLEDAFRKPDQKREFLEQCGLETPWAGVADSGVPASPPTLPDLFTVASLLLPKSKWIEPPCIYQPNDSPAFSELKQVGIYNRLILTAESSKPFTARLRKELHLIARASDEDLDQTALKGLFPHSPAGPSRESPTDESAGADVDAEIDLLNDEQLRACELSRRATLSVVTGPPGTGKSRVVANAMVRAALNEGSVLFASRNHQALEAVVPKLNEVAGSPVFPVRLNRPFGETQDNPFSEALKALLTNSVPREEIAKYGRMLSDLRGICGEVAKMREKLEIQKLKFIELETNEKELADVCREYPRHEDLLRHPPATSAIDGMDAIMASMIVLRDAGSGRLAKWIIMLRRWFVLRRKKGQISEVLRECHHHFEKKDMLLNTLQKTICPARFLEILKQMEEWLPIVQGLRLGRKTAALQEATRVQSRIEDMETNLVGERQRVMAQTSGLLKARSRILGAQLTPVEKQQLDTIWSGVRNYQNNPEHPGMRRLVTTLRKHFPLLVRHIPLWATTNLSVGRSIPLGPAIFDLLIVDEASQCDVASAIPLLYRAKRAVIVGDPKQLTFVASLNASADYRLRQKNLVSDPEPFERFSYRTKSLYGLAATSAELPAENLVMLREHFRCDAGIADYFNGSFYHDRLIVLTDRSSLNRPAGSPRGIVWTQIAADARAAPSSGAISEAQIRAITEELGRLKNAAFKGTVGVVTPFRAQANRILDQAQKMDLPDRWQFHSDTADGFQGGERDVILFSLVGGPDMPKGSEWFYQNDPNRFNVAISRARSVLRIFGDKEWARSWAAENASRQHIAKLVQAADRGPSDDFDMTSYNNAEPRPPRPRIIGDPDLIGPVWEQKLADALWARNLRIVQQYPACGRWLDIALLREGLKMDIEVDGECHRNFDGSRKADDLRRDISLIANGWTVIRFWTYELRENFESCVRRIIETWQNGA